MKYLHELSPGIFHLDHRLTPEVRAMFASMASRLPDGGIQKRYGEVVKAVAESVYNEYLARWDGEYSLKTWEQMDRESHGWYEIAEERLTTYPLHPVVQRFFDQFVGQYGHSSIQEQVGDPAVYVEGISWFTAWLLFDSPLVKGQEFSTRALRHKDWPMARECDVSAKVGGAVIMRDQELDVAPVVERTFPVPHLKYLHNDWLAVYDAEVEWWKEHLSDPTNRAALGIGDKEPFRPALDRARWALPGSISTGACFTSDLRERARVLLAGKYLGSSEQQVWQELAKAYCQAQPGIGPFALRKMFPEDEDLRPFGAVPGHVEALLKPQSLFSLDAKDAPEGVAVRHSRSPSELSYFGFNRLLAQGVYADPWTNRETRVFLDIDCSIAVARDWHRHRTLYPWSMFLALDGEGLLQIARDYDPKSDYAKEHTPALLKRSTDLYKKFMEGGDVQRAALALPLGTRVHISGSGGFRDVKYTLELRAFAHGANFEYMRQARAALLSLGGI
jgi:hypothetical protein